MPLCPHCSLEVEHESAHQSPQDCIDALMESRSKINKALKDLLKRKRQEISVLNPASAPSAPTPPSTKSRK